MDAAKRWHILRLHVEDQIPLAVLARETGISSRTLQRWHQLYRVGGVAALDPHARTDKGVRRTSAETVAFVERLALTRPRPSVATLHRLTIADAQAHELPSPSRTYLYLDAAQHGLGSRTCGMDVRPEHALWPGSHAMTVLLRVTDA